MAMRLLVSGAGDLGFRILRKLLQGQRLAGAVPSDIVCETQTSKRHASLLSLGFEGRLASDPPLRTPSLLICFPPSETYVADVQRALDQWDGTGPALLVSSIGVFSENVAGPVDERSPVDETSAIVHEEALALARGAHVLRLAGLYDRASGPHIHWQRQGEVAGAADGVINLLHRHDAADVCARMLSSSLAPRLWVVSDGSPLTRTEIVEAWALLTGEKPPTFRLADGEPSGMRVHPKQLFEALEWRPRWTSFLDFVDSLDKPRNVLGSPLKGCCLRPMTGYFRDGFCRTVDEDQGTHIVCIEATEDFLRFSKEHGNDLSTSRSELNFPGLKGGDRWCLCASRWLEALHAGVAPRLYLESTHDRMLEWVELEVLKDFGLDLA